MSHFSGVSSMAKILLIEDDANIAHLLRVQLMQRGHVVDVCHHGQEALKFFDDALYELFLIDRMLPGLNGVQLCQHLRSGPLHKLTPIIFLTALSRPEDIVEGLNAGADDYITKPYDINVLEARIVSVVRRHQLLSPKEKVIQVGTIRLDQNSHQVFVKDEEIHLTNSEYRILSFLLQNGRRVLSRAELVQFVQGERIHVTERTIDTHIAALRKKIKTASHLIETIRGVGYRVNCD